MVLASCQLVFLEFPDFNLSALYMANISIYDDSMQLLVYEDIQKVLKPVTDGFFGENGSLSLEDIYTEIFLAVSKPSLAVCIRYLAISI